MAELLRGSEDLPSLPGVAAEVLRITKDENASLDDLASAVAFDPALAARVLKLSNSSIFNLGTPVSTLQRAAMVLGMKTVKLVALSFSLAGCFQGAGAGVIDMRQYWKRSIACAVAARAFALRLERRIADEAFLCGLLSRVGQLVLGRSLAQRYEEVLSAAEGVWPTYELERRILGYDGGEVGEELLTSWGLPELLIKGVRSTHDPVLRSRQDRGDLEGLARILELAALCEELICGGDAATAMLALSESAAACGISEEELEEELLQLDAGIMDAAELLELRIRPTQVEAILREAQRRIVDETISLSSETRRLERSNRVLLGEARTDALTSLPNRAAFDESLTSCIEEQSGRVAGDGVGVLIFDVDHFKSFNDRYGHLVGDEVLKRVATAIRTVMRSQEFVARYGGEEFGAILPRVSPEGLLAAAERIRNAVAQTELPHAEETLSVTVSVGGAYAVKIGSEARPERLLEAADRCLYKAKRSGRNRSCVSSAELEL